MVAVGVEIERSFFSSTFCVIFPFDSFSFAGNAFTLSNDPAKWFQSSSEIERMHKCGAINTEQRIVLQA